MIQQIPVLKKISLASLASRAWGVNLVWKLMDLKDLSSFTSSPSTPFPSPSTLQKIIGEF